jgi:hypothetical protein
MSRLEDLRRIRDAVIEMPIKLQGARGRLHTVRQQLETASADVKDSEAEEMAMVAMLMTEPEPTLDVIASAKHVPKPAFPNKEAREAEVRRRLRNNKRHQGLLVEERKAEDEKATAERDLQRLIDDDKSLDRQLDAVGTALRAAVMEALTTAFVEYTLLEVKREHTKEGNHG